MCDKYHTGNIPSALVNNHWEHGGWRVGKGYVSLSGKVTLGEMIFALKSQGCLSYKQHQAKEITSAKILRIKIGFSPSKNRQFFMPLVLKISEQRGDKATA